MVFIYIAITSWLSVKLRSKTSGEFMNAAQAMPALIVAVLLMTEFIGAKSTVGTAESAFKYGMAAHGLLLLLRSGICYMACFLLKSYIVPDHLRFQVLLLKNTDIQHSLSYRLS